MKTPTEAEILAGKSHPACMCGRRYPDTPWDPQQHCGFCAPPPEPCDCGETSTFDLEAGVWREPACPNCA